MFLPGYAARFATTGEEFVLFNLDKVKIISKKKRKKEDLLIFFN